MDEQSPHLHLVFLSVVHTQDKKGNNINKQACSEFLKAKDSYRKLQKERDTIIADNKTLNNRVKDLEIEYKNKINILDYNYNNRKDELEKEFKTKEKEHFNIKFYLFSSSCLYI